MKDRTGIQSLVPTNIVRPNEKELMSLRAYLLLFLKQLMQPSQLGTGIQSFYHDHANSHFVLRVSLVAHF